ncbi:glycosyltransferase family 9 protein, partial [Plesiomonas sp.]|uniref:glycosyltransferase family 9 protein n=1 Tax=Plesiomonas sp. TaxID=2486279 RepID=UPI003F38E8B6
EAIDLLASCQAIITNDTGLMHVAAAVNTPIVALYGSSSPRYTPPLAQHVKTLHTDIECRPCFKKTCRYNHLRCLTELDPQTVLDALRTLITHPMQA